MSGSTIVIDVISVRRISAPPHTDYSYVATIRAGNQTVETAPRKIVSTAFSGQTLTFRDESISIKLNSTYDARRGLVVSIGSTCGKVHFGASSCAQPREWTQLSKPRGEVQLIFSQNWDSVRSAQRPRSAGMVPRNSSFSGSLSASQSSLPPAQRLDASLSPSSQTGSAYLGAGQLPWQRPGSRPNSARVSSTTQRRRFSNAPALLSPKSQQGGGAPLGLMGSSLERSPLDMDLPTTGTVIPHRAPSACNVNVLSIEMSRLAVALNKTEASFFFTLDFAGQEQLTASKVSLFTRSGYSGCWADRILEFDVPTALQDYNAQLCLWHGNQPSDARMVGQCIFSFRQTVEAEEVTLLNVKLTEIPTATVTLMAQSIKKPVLFQEATSPSRPRSARSSKVTTVSPEKLLSEATPETGDQHHHPHPDPASGSGTAGYYTPSATPVVDVVSSHPHHRVTFAPNVKSPMKQRPATAGAVASSSRRPMPTTVNTVGSSSTGGPLLPYDQQRPLSGSSDGATTTSSFLSSDSESETTSTSNAGRTSGGGAGASAAAGISNAKRMAIEAQQQKLLEAVLGTLTSTLDAALQPIAARVQKLDQRIARTEDGVSQLLKAQQLRTGGGDHQAAVPTGYTSSRPSSAESTAASVNSGAGKLLITNEELWTRFSEYDIFDTGFMTTSQLMHFYRVNHPFADDESEDSILQELSRQVVGLEDNRVSFDDFCRVALRLAKT